ncbi:ATP-binding protein [Streptomyces sp. NPDC048258]|uniref:ATP-binding protein n=1 Tax=Streptomyces sp. NPDC048258 TaxID=3365527 RepID=UPI00371AE86F
MISERWAQRRVVARPRWGAAAAEALAGHGHRTGGRSVGRLGGRAVPQGAATEIEPCRIRGDFVADLSHLLAELTENALVYSAVQLPVEVYGWRDLDEYCLAVVDRGIDMSPEELARANARLSGDESFLVAPTRYLGHYVAGRLTGRLGAHVELRPTEGSGITAYPSGHKTGATRFDFCVRSGGSCPCVPAC